MAENKWTKLSSKLHSEAIGEQHWLDKHGHRYHNFSRQSESKSEYFRQWAQWSGVMDANGMYWKECYPESEPLNEGEDDGSIDWGGNFYGGCHYHNDADW